MDNDQTESAPLERASTAGCEEPVEDYISLSVATIGNVVKLEHVPLTATIAEVVNGVRREPLTDWNDVALILFRRGNREPQTLSPHQSLREAGVLSGDTLIHGYPIKLSSGWQEVGLFLATSAGAGVVGGAAYDLLKSTLRSAAGRWRERRASTSPSLSRDEVLRIAQACLAMDSGIELQGLKAVSIGPDPTSRGGPETWVVCFMLPHQDLEVKVSVPADGPEHAMVFIDHQTVGQLPNFHPEQ